MVETEQLIDLPSASAVSPQAVIPVQEPGGPVSGLEVGLLMRGLTATGAIFTTLALLNADLAYAPNTVALVYADPTPLANGWYTKLGASGAGNWVQFETLSLAAATSAATSAAAAIAAAAAAAAQADLATTEAGNATSAASTATAQAATATGAASTATAQAGIATSEANAAAVSALNASNSAGAAQGIAAGTFIDSHGNLVIGTSAVAPTDGGDGSAVILGSGSGVGLSQTYSRKPVAIGLDTYISGRGYAAVVMGAYTGARAVGDYAVYLGTHAGQDMNVIGSPLLGFGTRAKQTITLTGAMSDGDTITINGVVLTARTMPSASHDFQIGASAAATALNLLSSVLGLTDVGIQQGCYALNAIGGTVITVASSSLSSYGNSFTLATTSSAVTLSGATLAGGTTAANTGLPANMAAPTAVGFAALAANGGTTSRAARAALVFSANPVNASAVLMGFNFSQQVNFMTTPVGALDVQLGATIPATVANATALLNGSANGVINAVSYYGAPTASGTPKLAMEHKTANVNTFYLRSLTSAITPDSWHLRGGCTSVPVSNVAVGNAALSGGFASGTVALGYFSGANSTLVNSAILNGANSLNGQNIFAWGAGSLNYLEGDDVIAIGTGIGGATQDAWLSVAAISTAGVITFTAPHGWRQGSIYPCSYQDSTAGSTVIQSVAYLSGGTLATLSKSLTGISLIVINAMQAMIIQTTPDPGTGSPVYQYQVNSGGTVTNLQVARTYLAVENAIALGNGAALQKNAMHLGSANYFGGGYWDAPGLYLTAGQLQLPTILAPTWATGRILFFSYAQNFAAGDTVTLNGTVFTAQPEACLFQATTTSGSASLVMLSASVAFPVVGQVISGTGIPSGTTITAVGSGPSGFGTLIMSANATATSAATGVTVTGAGVFNVAAAASIRSFAIGLSLYDSLNNLLTCIANSNDGSAAAQAVNQGLFWLSAPFSDFQLNFQATTTLGNSYTLATSHSGTSVTSPSGGNNGSLPTASSQLPPVDKGLVMLSASPLRNGGPGPALYSAATNSWKCI